MIMDSCKPTCPTSSHIDLWIAPTDENHKDTVPGNALCNYFQVVSKEEKQKFGQIRHKADRTQYIATRVLLRKALSNAVNDRVEPRNWRFEKSLHGKPVIATSAGLPHLNFSISHTKGLAVVAISPTANVGVDVESLDHTMIVAPTDISLSVGEHKWLKSRPESSRCIGFLKLWTVKEAYAKLVGLGINLDFSSFEIGMEPLRMLQDETGQQLPANLHLVTQTICKHDTSYQLSIAARCLSTPKPKVVIHLVDSKRAESWQDEMIAQ